jgi:hypothetical protein
MAWPLGAVADYNFVVGVEDKLKLTHDSLNTTSANAISLRKQITDALAHVKVFKLHAVSTLS